MCVTVKMFTTKTNVFRYILGLSVSVHLTSVSLSFLCIDCYASQLNWFISIKFKTLATTNKFKDKCKGKVWTRSEIQLFANILLANGQIVIFNKCLSCLDKIVVL